MSIFLLLIFPLYLARLCIRNGLDEVLQSRRSLFLGIFTSIIAGATMILLRNVYTPNFSFASLYAYSFLVYIIIPYGIMIIVCIPFAIARVQILNIQVRLFLTGFFALFHIILSLSHGELRNPFLLIFYPLFNMLAVSALSYGMSSDLTLSIRFALCLSFLILLALIPLVLSFFDLVMLGGSWMLSSAILIVLMCMERFHHAHR